MGSRHTGRSDRALSIIVSTLVAIGTAGCFGGGSSKSLPQKPASSRVPIETPAAAGVSTTSRRTPPVAPPSSSSRQVPVVPTPAPAPLTAAPERPARSAPFRPPAPFAAVPFADTTASEQTSAHSAPFVPPTAVPPGAQSNSLPVAPGRTTPPLVSAASGAAQAAPVGATRSPASNPAPAVSTTGGATAVLPPTQAAAPAVSAPPSAADVPAAIAPAISGAAAQARRAATVAARRSSAQGNGPSTPSPQR